MTSQNGSVAHRCRYRLVTNCTAYFATQPGRSAHEKSAHPDIVTPLRDCPECGETLADEMARGKHLAKVHDLPATSERRQQLDALQVQKILAGTAATPVLVPPPVVSPFAAPQPVIPPSPNGHSAPAPAPDAARDQVSALIAEVRELRAENARLKADAATLAEIRGMLADIG